MLNNFIGLEHSFEKIVACTVSGRSSEVTVLSFDNPTVFSFDNGTGPNRLDSKNKNKK
jgi:hypothetical protein